MRRFRRSRIILHCGVARLEQLSGNHATCSITEFAVWMKVSRQTVYNWKDSNYLVFTGNKVNLPETLDLHLFRPFQRHPAAGGDEMAKADAMKLFDEELKK